MKKLHYFKTPEGRKRASLIAKANWAKRRESMAQEEGSVRIKTNCPMHLAYVYGRTEAQLEVYAAQNQLPLDGVLGVIGGMLRARAAGAVGIRALSLHE